jgi:hypothetical protein
MKEYRDYLCKRHIFDRARARARARAKAKAKAKADQELE